MFEDIYPTFAPAMPYITEEIWSWRFIGSGRDKSVHSTQWPDDKEISDIVGDVSALEAATEVLSVVRGCKTSAQKGQRWGVSSLVIRGHESHLKVLGTVLDDVIRAANVLENGTKLIAVETEFPTRFEVEVVLSQE